MLFQALLMVLLFVASSLAAAQGKVTFKGEATPEFLEIDGKGGVVNGSLKRDGAKISGVFTVQLKDFTTGIELRDQHMREKYLEVDKYAEAKLVLNPVAATGTQTFSGLLTLHGVTRKVTGKAEFKGGQAVASFQIDLTEFGIAVPTYKLLTVGRIISVVAEFPI